MKKINVKSQAELDAISRDLEVIIQIAFGHTTMPAIVNCRPKQVIELTGRSCADICHDVLAVIARDESSVYTAKDTYVIARDSSLITVGCGSIVDAFDNSHIVTTTGSDSLIKAHDKSRVDVRSSNAWVLLHDNSFAELHVKDHHIAKHDNASYYIVADHK